VEARDLLVEIKVTVRHGRVDNHFIAELNIEQADSLTSKGFRIEKLYDSLQEEDEALKKQPGFDEIHTYNEIRTDFLALEAEYPDIAQFVLFGYSVQNRELFGLRITDNPTIEENEPELVFWGNIHGNEYTSAEIPYLYAGYLCHNYGILPNITQYVEDNEIWIVPMINPDGRENGTRNNANNVDLNRDCGYQWDGWGGSPGPFSQVETQVLREFCIDNNLSISNSYHNSGDEMYHPWGFWPNDAPDIDLMVRVGERYANAADYNFFSSFNSYPTHGEILDFAYGLFGGLSYTLEISSSSTNVQYTFERNLPGMNMFCGFTGEGIHGMVTDAVTGDPLHAAVWIIGNPFPSYTDPEVGDYHRLVLPGTYDLKVWANGYQPMIIENVAVVYGNPGEFTAELTPGDGEYAFLVVSVQQKDQNNAYNNRTNPSWALGAPDSLPCSLGSGGFIVLDMGEDHEITNGPGDDFTVVEALHEHDPNYENYRVYTGTAYTQGILIGDGFGTTSFDLDVAGINSARFLKIVDASGASPNLPLAGMDLDAVIALNTGEQVESADLSGDMMLPGDFSFKAYPNPFNSSTAISYQLLAFCQVNLTVYDIQGREVAKLADSYQNAGNHEIIFNAKDLVSGVYFVRFTVDSGQSMVRKMLLMK